MEERKMKVLAAYDGTLDAKITLRYGMEKVKENGGELIVFHVFNANLFLDYDAIPQAEEIARRESARYAEEAERIIREEGRGIKASIILDEGNPEKKMIRCANIENADIIFVPPRYRSIIKNAPCTVSIIPGNVIIPVDNNDYPITKVDQIAKEARAACSKVILLGLIPVNVYSKSEKEEIHKITAETSLIVKRLKEMLNEQGVNTREIIRSGYPDEEIVKVTNEYPVTMIIFLTEWHKPSELSKTINMILEESDRLKMPVLSVPAKT
jgi:nucleotide-binding universal stress UspA family protein